MLALLSSSSTSLLFRSLRKSLALQHNPTILAAKAFSFFTTTTTMSVNLQSHAFAGNPRLSRTLKSTHPLSPNLALETLKTQLLKNAHQPSSVNFKVLPFRKGRPLASSGAGEGDVTPKWNLGWMNLADFKGLLGKYGVELSGDRLVYLGSKSEEEEDDVVFWAIDVSDEDSLVPVFGEKRSCFVELRTLMVATDWADDLVMGDLAIAGHARALLEWHNTSRFCGHCGVKTAPLEAGRRLQCSNESCKKRIYPRVDPVVIMLVIDKENDRVLLGRQSRFVPRLWSCLAGFIEPGESLEEAVRRETWEEAGIEVGEVVYHSSQPWPVCPSGIPCQLMVGFFAYAKSVEIDVDKEELQDAQWHSREDVKRAFALAEYKKAQVTAADKVNQMCRGVERGQSLSTDFNLESGELAPMFFPGPFAIAHHLISSWVNNGSTIGEAQLKQPSSSLSNL